MPTITVKTRPIKGEVVIWRVNPSGMMAMGSAPQSASRVYPWPYAIGLQPVVVNGVLWVPEVNEQRGMCERDTTLTFQYLRVGRILTELA